MPHVLLNRQLLPAAEARISPLSDGFLFGQGVFETIKVRATHPLFLADHHARLTASSAAFGLQPPPSLPDLHQLILRLLAADRLTHAAVKIVRFQDLSGTAELITTRPLPYSQNDYARGFRVKTFVQGPRDGRLTTHKSLNYLENLLARRAALEARCDEALFLTPDDRVLEGAVSTVFAVREGIALTPPLTSGILPGVARARVLTLLGPDRAREADLTRADLLAADELFLTNALMGVMPVCALDAHRVFPASPVITALRQAWLHLESTRP